MDVPDDLRIYIDDIRRAGHCTKGARRSFEAAGADFRSFMKQGLPAPEFIALGGGLAEQVVTRKLERELVGVDLSGVVVTALDAQAAGKCALGTRRFATRAGLDFSAYLEAGISADELIATGDPDALEVVRYKLKALDRGR